MLHCSLFRSKVYMGTMSIDCNDLFCVRRNVLSECNRLANWFVCCAVTMAEKDQHVRVVPQTSRWNLQEFAKSAQILTPRKRFSCGYSSAARLESQFFSFGFCYHGKVCVHCWYSSLLSPFSVAHSCISVSLSPWSRVRVPTPPPCIITQLNPVYTPAATYTYKRASSHTGPQYSKALHRDSLWHGLAGPLECTRKPNHVERRGQNWSKRVKNYMDF